MEKFFTASQVDKRSDFVELIRYVYGDSNGKLTRSLDFKSEGVSDFETFAEALKASGSYNAFEAEKTIEAFRSIWDEIGGVEIAREGSPVLYVVIPFFTNQRTIGSSYGERIDSGKRKKLIDEIKAIAKDLEADEITDDEYRVRIWWD